MEQNQRRTFAGNDGMDPDVAGAQHLVTEVVQLEAHG
jgi:hypothetical protein